MQTSLLNAVLKSKNICKLLSKLMNSMNGSLLGNIVDIIYGQTAT